MPQMFPMPLFLIMMFVGSILLLSLVRFFWHLEAGSKGSSVDLLNFKSFDNAFNQSW